MTNSTAKTLRAAGEALYGALWQAELARALDVNLRTLQRWAAGASPVRDSVWNDVASLCAERGKALQEMARQLREKP